LRSTQATQTFCDIMTQNSISLNAYTPNTVPIPNICPLRIYCHNTSTRDPVCGVSFPTPCPSLSHTLFPCPDPSNFHFFLDYCAAFPIKTHTFSALVFSKPTPRHIPHRDQLKVCAATVSSPAPTLHQDPPPCPPPLLPPVMSPSLQRSPCPSSRRPDSFRGQTDGPDTCCRLVHPRNKSLSWQRRLCQ